ncbi:MAG: hypothetical protein ACR2QB_01665 [Gammaproteobacteria bacterium]
MSRTNISILLATGLLGVLLFVVRQIVVDQPVEPIKVPVASRSPEQAAPEAVLLRVDESGEALPVIDSPAALRALLIEQGMAPDIALADTRDWFAARGYLASGPLRHLVGDTRAADYYASLDDDTLRSLSEGGEVLATQELAGRQRVTDPFAALGSYQAAANQGSVNALLKMASLRETLAEIRPEDFASDPGFVRQLSRVAGKDGTALRIAAYGNVLTAMRDGGPAVIDDELMGWAQEMESRLTPMQQTQACNRSFNEFIGLSNQRRLKGMAPITVTPPPTFLALPELDARLPCQETISPVATTQILDDCIVREVVDGRGGLRELYLCPL